MAERVVTKSAFCAARQKLSPSAFIELNRHLVRRWYHDAPVRWWRGFDLRGIDRTTLRLPDTPEAIARFGQMFPARSLAADVTALNTAYPGLKRLIKVTAGLATYIANNAAAVVNYRRRWDNGERISTAFAESTVNLVISRRFAKKQQMQCSKERAHRLLQTRTKTLDGTLRDLFTRWYPGMSVNDNQVPPLARTA